MKTHDYEVYIIFKLDASPCYVGKGHAGRHREHQKFSHSKHLSSIMKQANYKLPVVIIQSDLTNEQAKSLEILLIQVIGRIDLSTGPLVNLTNGGDGNSGWAPNQQTRDKISAKAKARFENEDERLKLSQKVTGFKHSEETKAKIRQARKGKPPAWSLDAAQGLIVKQKISETHKGKVLTDRHKELIREKLSNTIWVTNGTKNKRIKNDQLLPEGWKFGRTTFVINLPKQQTIWITNDIVIKRVPINQPVPEGWRAGRPLSFSSYLKQKIWITNEIINQRHPNSEPIPEGWRRGRMPNLKKRKSKEIIVF